jgi:hypothetical protein
MNAVMEEFVTYSINNYSMEAGYNSACCGASSIMGEQVRKFIH